jgi:aryl-phospho-beta-D-glucosidase BglC (GH1 family)
VIFLPLFSINIFAGDFVSVNGKYFIDAEGNKLILKGINLGNWLLPEGYMFKFSHASSPRLIEKVLNELIGVDEAAKFWESFRDNYTTHEDIKFIKQAGFNSVRVPFNFRLFVVEDHPEIFLKKGFEMLDRVIRWCTDEKVFVILDMHGAPGGQTGDNIDDSWGYPFLYESRQSRETTIQLWKKIAERYAEEKILIGYDLLNEPIAHYFDKELLNPKLEPLFKEIVSAIREVDTNHIVFLGGAQWNSNFDVFGPPFDSKAVYTFHKYWTDTTQEVIQSYIDFGNKYNVPIWMGESGENTNEWIKSFRILLEKNEVGWAFWPYKKLDSQSCVVSIKKPDEYDLLINYASLPRTTYEEIRNNRPDIVKIKAALNEYLENIKLKNCEINYGYLEALGLK